MATSFWELFFDSDRQRRSDINATREATQELDDNLAKVAAASAVSRERIRELSVGFEVLIQLLAERGLVDVEQLKSRMFDLLHTARAAAPPTEFPDPWRAVPPAAAPPSPGGAPTGDPYRSSLAAREPERVAPCYMCGRMVAERLTVITEHGMVCDVCSAKGAT